MAVGFPTKVNFLTGDVLQASEMNDLAGTVNLLNGTQYAGGKNRVLNSAFEVWQRGTTGVAGTATGKYFADRWSIARGVAGSLGTRQTTSDTTNLPNIQYCARVSRDAANTATQAIYLAQSFESVNSIPLAGKTITFSFYARAGANYSPASSVLNAQVLIGTGTDQSILTGFTGGSAFINQNATLTTTWQRFTYSGTIASTATQIGFNFINTPVGTAGAADYYEITGVQLEASTVASAFSTNGGTYQAELAACQRYYYRATTASGTRQNAGLIKTTSTAEGFVPYPVTMRTAPTALEQSATAGDYTIANLNTTTVCTSVPTFASASIYAASTNFTTGATLVAGQSCFPAFATASGFLGWSAEL